MMLVKAQFLTLIALIDLNFSTTIASTLSSTVTLLQPAIPVFGTSKMHGGATGTFHRNTRTYNLAQVHLPFFLQFGLKKKQASKRRPIEGRMTIDEWLNDKERNWLNSDICVNFYLCKTFWISESLTQIESNRPNTTLMPSVHLK